VEEYQENDQVLVRDYLKPYLRDLYADLAIRVSVPVTTKSPSKNSHQQHVQVLDNLTFLPFTRLPLILAERLFSILSRKRGSESGVMQEEFVDGLLLVFVGRFRDRIQMIFKL
jgi:hypothetical protein